MSHIVETKAEQYEKLFIAKFEQKLRKCSILKMLHFFLCSVYIILYKYIQRADERLYLWLYHILHKLTVFILVAPVIWSRFTKVL